VQVVIDEAVVEDDVHAVMMERVTVQMSVQTAVQVVAAEPVPFQIGVQADRRSL
jgi:hypothetical protein